MKREIEAKGDVVIDAALLLEMGLQDICDMTIGVIACEDTCIKRIMERDNLSLEDAKARIHAQKENSFFQVNCDYCLDNEEESNLKKQLAEIFCGENLSNQTMLQSYQQGVSYLQFRRFLAYGETITHCYTMKPLDFQITENKTAKEDYKRILKALQLEKGQLCRPSQVHSKTIKKVGEESFGIYSKEFQNTDGLLTNQAGKVLSLTFADCIPLYFYDPVRQVIGNVHSGWKGTYQEIAREAVRMLRKEFGVNPKDLICGIGPSIRKCCFEVDEEVKEMFYQKWKDSSYVDEMIQKSGKIHHYWIDTVLMNKIILKQEGLQEENIIDSGICTKCQAKYFHSYRKQRDNAGRNMAMITIKNS